MGEEDVEVNHETIGVKEQRNLIEVAHNLNSLLTKEEYTNLIGFYYGVT